MNAKVVASTAEILLLRILEGQSTGLVFSLAMDLRIRQALLWAGPDPSRFPRFVSRKSPEGVETAERLEDLVESGTIRWDRGMMSFTSDPADPAVYTIPVGNELLADVLEQSSVPRGICKLVDRASPRPDPGSDGADIGATPGGATYTGNRLIGLTPALWDAASPVSANGHARTHLPMVAGPEARPVPDRAGACPVADALDGEASDRHGRSSGELHGEIRVATARLRQASGAMASWTPVADEEGEVFSPIDVHAASDEARAGFRRHDQGIVPRVAFTRLAYASGDVGADPFYKPCVRDVEIHSEQAAAILEGRDGRAKRRVLAVINQESHIPGRFSPASAELLRQDAQAALAPLLQEERALKGPSGAAFAWRPESAAWGESSGWGLRGYLSGLLEGAKNALLKIRALPPSTNGLHASIWYADLDDRVLSWVASTGQSNGMEACQVTRFGDAGLLGRLADAADWDTRAWRPDGGAEPMNPPHHERMGTLGSRLIVGPRLSAPGGVAPFRIVVQVDAGSDEAVSLLPDDDGMRRVGQLIHDQVRGYLELYPRRAAAEVLRAIHDSPSLTDQWHAVAEAMERVLRAAVVIYARPWQEVDLHMMAATRPLRAPGVVDSKVLGPRTSPTRSLVPSPLAAGDRGSYAGVLAGRPGEVVVRTSLADSGNRLEAAGFPRTTSARLVVELPRTVGSERRLVGYSLPNESRGGKGKKEKKASAGVALALRSTDHAMFKAWDVAALVAMFDAAAPVVRSWRDWAAVRLPKAKELIAKAREVGGAIAGGRPGPVHALDLRGKDGGPIDDHAVQGLVLDTVSSALIDLYLTQVDLPPHRRQDPIPRVGSLRSFSREVAVAAFECAKEHLGDSDYPVVQAAVLMEGRGRDRSLMQQVGYYHRDRNECPHRDAQEDPRRLRVAGFDDWRNFLGAGLPHEFRISPDAADGPVVAGVRIPFLAWIGRHAARGALALDLRRHDDPLKAAAVADLLLLARRLAAGWTASGSAVPRGKFVGGVRPQEFAERLQRHLKADTLALRFDVDGSPKSPWVAPGDRVAASPSDPFASVEWMPPTLTTDRPREPRRVIPDPDAALWGVSQTAGDRCVTLRVPLYFGTVDVGHVVARWSGSAADRFHQDPQTVRARRVRDITSAWSLWSWGWTGQGERDVLRIDPIESGGVWTPKISFIPEAIPVPM